MTLRNCNRPKETMAELYDTVVEAAMLRPELKYNMTKPGDFYERFTTAEQKQQLAQLQSEDIGNMILHTCHFSALRLWKR